MEQYQLTSTARLSLLSGDITEWTGDAIVNAANQAMLGGGGVDGAIHKVAGPGLLAACRQVPESRPGIRCPTGEARITTAGGGGLRVPWVIHAVGPVYRDARTSAPLLASTYTRVLELACCNALTRIAFPAISCGVYGYPLDEAAVIALETCQLRAGTLHEVAFVLFGPDAWQAFKQAADDRLTPLSPLTLL